MRVKNASIAFLRYVAAVILLQTLFYKFSGHEESVYIFSTVGMEPWGRYLVGIMELIAAILLISPHLYWLGGLLGMALMAGAIFFHLTILGIEVKEDSGYLFYLSVIVFIASLLAALNKRKEIPLLKKLF